MGSRWMKALDGHDVIRELPRHPAPSIGVLGAAADGGDGIARGGQSAETMTNEK